MTSRPDLYELLLTGKFRWYDPVSRRALPEWEGTILLPADDPRLPAVQTAVIRYSKVDRAPDGEHADRRVLSRLAREIEEACRLPAEGAP